MGAEERPEAVLAAELHRLRRAPTVAAHDGTLPAQLVRLLHDQSHLVVVLGREQDLGARTTDLGELGAEISVLGGEALIRHHGAGAVELLPRPLEKFGESLRIVTGHVVENRGLGVLELVGDEVRQNRPLERIEERRAEHVRTVLGGVGVGRPRTDHRRFPVLGHPARGNRLLGGLRADDDQHFVLGDQLGIGLHRGLGLGLVVLDDQLHLVFLAPDLEAAGAVHVGKPHLGRELGALADLGNVASQRDVEADLDGLGRNTRGQGKNGHSTDDGVQMSFQFHGCLLSVFLLGFVLLEWKNRINAAAQAQRFF